MKNNIVNKYTHRARARKGNYTLKEFEELSKSLEDISDRLLLLEAKVEEIRDLLRRSTPAPYNPYPLPPPIAPSDGDYNPWTRPSIWFTS